MKFAGDMIRKGYNYFVCWRNNANSRKQAHLHRAVIVKGKKHASVGRQEIKKIKEYAGDVLGDSGYWPWLACYTEIRGEFKEGWVPDDYYRHVLIRQLNPFTEAMLSTTKSFDNRLFDGFSLEPIAVKISGGFYNAEMKPLTEQEFLKMIKADGRELVIKLDGGPSGSGLVFKHSGLVTQDDFKKGCNYVVQPLLEQHDLLKKLNSSSLNTIRIVTLLQPPHDVSCIYATLKFGNKGSRIDNLGKGGRFYCLTENGHLMAGPYNSWGQKVVTDELPDLNSGTGGFSVPSFREAIKKCIESHLKFPYVRLIGWDVAIDHSGTPRLVEWNAREPGNMPEEALIGPLFPKEISYPKSGV